MLTRILLIATTIIGCLISSYFSDMNEAMGGFIGFCLGLSIFFTFPVNQAEDTNSLEKE